MWAGLALFCGAAAGAALPAKASPPSLGANLAGWNVTQAQVTAQPPWGLSPAQTAVMREFGLRAAERAVLVPPPAGGAGRADRDLPVLAFAFGDASGAYGAFTAWRAPGSARRLAGGAVAARSADATPAWLLLRNHWLLRLPPGVKGATLTALSRSLPRLSGGSSALPLLPQYLPAPDRLARRYVEGPAGLAQASPWFPAAAAGFSSAAEGVVGDYRGGGQIVILSFPTPRLAADQLPILRRALATESGAVARRSGSFLIVSRGMNFPAEAALAAGIHDRVVLSWTRPPGLEALPALILGCFALVGVLAAISLSIGVTTGGARLLLAKWFPRRFARERRILRLNL